MKSFFIFSSFLILLSGCSVDVGDNGGVKKESLTYNYTVKGCETGEHSFSSLTDMCYALANDELNNHCAGGIRCDRFKRDCHSLPLEVTCQ